MSASALNHRLATLLGWSNIAEVPGALLGRPPEGSPESRDQCLVPNWEGDWRDCGPLMVEHDCYPQEFLRGSMSVFHHDMGWLADCSFTDMKAKQSAALQAVVAAVIAKLEARQ